MSCRGVALRPRFARRGACGCVTPVELVRIVKEQRSAASRPHGTGFNRYRVDCGNPESTRDRSAGP